MDARSLETLKTVLVHIRMPRVVGAVLVGAALSVSGATLQSIFVNPLVSPGLLGILAGASFGAALGMFFSSTWLTVQASAVLFGMVAVAFAVGLAALYRGDRILLLVLGGIISSSLFNSLYLMMKYLANPYSQLPAIVYWLMGGFSLADSKTTLALSFPILSGLLLLLLLLLPQHSHHGRRRGKVPRRPRRDPSAVLHLYFHLISSLTVAYAEPSAGSGCWSPTWDGY